MNVTRRLFEELELSVLDSFQDYLPIDSVDNVALKAAERQGAAGMADNVLDWSPAGVEASSDED